MLLLMFLICAIAHNAYGSEKIHTTTINVAKFPSMKGPQKITVPEQGLYSDLIKEIRKMYKISDDHGLLLELDGKPIHFDYPRSSYNLKTLDKDNDKIFVVTPLEGKYISEEETYLSKNTYIVSTAYISKRETSVTKTTDCCFNDTIKTAMFVLFGMYVGAVSYMHLYGPSCDSR